MQPLHWCCVYSSMTWWWLLSTRRGFLLFHIHKTFVSYSLRSKQLHCTCMFTVAQCCGSSSTEQPPLKTLYTYWWPKPLQVPLFFFFLEPGTLGCRWLNECAELHNASWDLHKVNSTQAERLRCLWGGLEGTLRGWAGTCQGLVAGRKHKAGRLQLITGCLDLVFSVFPVAESWSVSYHMIQAAPALSLLPEKDGWYPFDVEDSVVYAMLLSKGKPTFSIQETELPQSRGELENDLFLQYTEKNVQRLSRKQTNNQNHQIPFLQNLDVYCRFSCLF